MKKNNQPAVIKVNNVHKQFRLPHERTSSLKSLIVRPWAHKRQYERQHALEAITFEVKKGEFFGIVGRNGSGKSTLLKMLAGIYQPTKGSVTVEGRLVPFIELGVGFNPELTGRENVYLNGALLGFSRSQIDAQYEDIVRFSELERFMDQKLKNYSSGMQVRLAFSVAIMSNADILLVDEVLAVGDADFQRKCFEYFRSLKKAKKTVIFVTHDMNAVREYCDRAILINASRLVQEGSPEDIAESYTRLFVEEEAEAREQHKTGERWGNNFATVTEVKLSKKTLTQADKTISLDVTITANRDIESPIAGFLIKDAADNHLFGTNTRIKHFALKPMKKGESRQIRWQMPNILAAGKHFVDVTIEANDGVTVYDWWTEATEFTSHNPEKTAYHITPPIEVSLVN